MCLVYFNYTKEGDSLWYTITCLDHAISVNYSFIFFLVRVLPSLLFQFQKWKQIWNNYDFLLKRIIFFSTHFLAIGTSSFFLRLFCDKTFHEKIQHTRLPMPQKEPLKDQTTDTLEVQFQFGGPMSFIGVVCINMGEGLITGAEMAQWQLDHQGPPQLTNLETRSTLHNMQAA